MVRRVLVAGLCGLPGAGKSTLARALCERLDFRLVDRDAIRRAQFPLCAYSSEEKDAATDAALSAVVANCRLGFPSLIDGMTFAARSERRHFTEVTARAGGEFYALYLDCPVEEARRRVSDQPDSPAADRDASLVDRVHVRFEPPEGEGLRLDATVPPDVLLERAVRAISLLREATLGE